MAEPPDRQQRRRRRRPSSSSFTVPPFSRSPVDSCPNAVPGGSTTSAPRAGLSLYSEEADAFDVQEVGLPPSGYPPFQYPPSGRRLPFGLCASSSPSRLSSSRYPSLLSFISNILVFPLPNGDVAFLNKAFEVAVTLYPGKVIIGVGPNYLLARDAAAGEVSVPFLFTFSSSRHSASFPRLSRPWTRR